MILKVEANISAESGKGEQAIDKNLKQRSEPGKGEPINLFLLKPGKSGPDPFIKSYENTSMMGYVKAEDFAKCHWEIVVKSKLQVSPGELVQSLRDLADAIEGGFFTHDDRLMNEGQE
ncbi:MAG TPA: hypothetical protein VGA99_09340 [bacterium]